MSLSEITKRVRNLVASRGFFYATLAVTTLSCLVFILSINYRIPPDEFFHFEFIEFYAGQPISNGPFISDQGLEYFDLRDITRTPNYLYHYLMSFVLRATRLVTESLFAQVVVLRLLTLGMGIASLFVVRRILRQINASLFTQNFVIFLLSLTGMLLWIFSSINYDVPAIGLYWLCVSVALSIMNGKGITTKRLALFSVFAMACVLTKVTFLPFLAILVLLIAFLKRKDFTFSHNLSLKGWANIALVTALVVIGFLFVERVGINAVRYQQIEVACDKIHAYESCMQDDVFRRNELQRARYAEEKANGMAVSYKPIEFTRSWLFKMYDRIHFYFGHEQIYASNGARLLAKITAAILLILALLQWRKIIQTPGEKLLAGILVSYVLVMYVFNLRTYLIYGIDFAFQGRYLLPIVPFLYYFIVKVLVLTSRGLSTRRKQIFIGGVALLMILSTFIHLPILIFYRGTEAKWYPDSSREFNLQVQNTLEITNIRQIR